MTRNRAVAMLAGGLLVVVLGACGSSGGSDAGAGGDDAGSGSSTKSLNGSAWSLTSMTPTVAELDGVSVSAKFAGGNVSGHSGCNTYRASFDQQDTSLTFGPVATTRMACPAGPSAVEHAYLDRLATVASFTRTSSVLTLKDASGATVLVFGPAPEGEALTGDWSVTSLYTGDALASPVGADLTATFDADGVHGNSGCNTFRGATKIDGSDITIGPISTTLMACTDAALSTQEQQYTQALEAAKTFEVVGDRLSLFRDDGGYAVVFVRA